MLTKQTVTLQSYAVALIGLFCLSEPINRLLGHATHNTVHVPIYFPVALALTWILPIIGIGLVFSAFYISLRKQVAYVASLIGLSCLLSISLAVRHIVLADVLIVMLLVWLVLNRDLYNARSDIVSMRRGLTISFAMVGTALIYGVLGFEALSKHGFGQSIGPLDAFRYTIATLVDSTPVAPISRVGDLFIDSLNVVGTSALLLSLASLFKPVRFAIGHQAGDRAVAQTILQTHSLSADDYFKLWPHDKHYFFSNDKTAFIAYGLSKRTAIILGDPGGDVKQFRQTLHEFAEFAHKNGWLIACINSTTLSGSVYDELNFNKLFIGNDAIIQTKQFIKTETRSKHFRYVTNRALKDGLQTEFWHHPSKQQFEQLAIVSNSWLGRSGRREYGFFMGYFDAHYLQDSQIIVLKQHDRVVAYINIVPSYIANTVSIDHIRSLNKTSSIATHYLLMELIVKLEKDGIEVVNLGLAPLSGLDRRVERTAQDKLLLLIKLLGNRYYSFKGLEQFKGKFRPDWQPNYLYYQAAPALLPLVIRDIEWLAKR